MKTFRSNGRAGAFTLIEILCVIAIIALLAALFLPALTRGRARAQRIQCVSQLHQAGQAFHGFAHDHNSHFPMQVPVSAGGSLEFAQSTGKVQGEFCFAYPHFQALSNELVIAKLVHCPADTRLPAANFALLKNENLSYFVGVNADYALPNSILAGDRNITNDWLAAAAVQHLGPEQTLRWTHELHRFKGNLLFADGRVEEKNTPGLLAANNQYPNTAKLVVPSAKPFPPATSFEPPAAPGATQSAGPTLPGKVEPQSNSAPALAHSRESAPPTRTSVREATLSAATSNPPGTAAQLVSNSTAPPRAHPAEPPQGNQTGVAAFSHEFSLTMDRLVKKGFWLFLLLILLAVAALEVRRRFWRRNSRPPRF